MGFTIHFYIIFGTNLLTGGSAQIAVFLTISVFRRKGISNGIQTERNLRQDFFGTNAIQESWSGRQGSREEATRQQGVPRGARRAVHPRGPLVAPPTYFLRLYILLYPKNIQGSHETTFPPPQPSVPVRSHIGTFFGVLPKGGLITEGFYINTITSPTKHE